MKTDSVIEEAEIPDSEIQMSSSGSRLPFLFTSIIISVLADSVPGLISIFTIDVAKKPTYVLYALGIEPSDVKNSPAFQGLVPTVR